MSLSLILVAGLIIVGVIGGLFYFTGDGRER